MSTTTLTVDQITRWGPCSSGPGERYSREGLRKLFGGEEITTVGVGDLPIPPEDKLWVWLRPEIIPERDLRLLAVLFASRALPVFGRRHPDAGRLVSTLRTARRYALGQATLKELIVAWVAARDGAWAAARAAARDAAEAAEAAARAAAEAAVRATEATEREWQVEQVRAYLAGELDLLAATAEFGDAEELILPDEEEK